MRQHPEENEKNLNGKPCNCINFDNFPHEEKDHGVVMGMISDLAISMMNLNPETLAPFDNDFDLF